MKHRNMFLKYMSPMQEGGEGGSTQSEQGTGETTNEQPAVDGQPSDEAKGETEAEQTEGDQKDPATVEGEQKEGETLSQREADLVKEVMKKKGKISELTDQLAQFEGVDLEKYKALLEKEKAAAEAEKEAETQRLISEGKFEELLAQKELEGKSAISQMAEQHKAALATMTNDKAELETKIAALTSTIEELTVGNAFSNSDLIRNKLVSAFTPERTRKLYGEHFDIVDGQIIGYDKPRTDPTRVKLVNSEGKAADFEDALTRIIQSGGDATAMFRSSAKQGAGSFTTNGQVFNPAPEIGEGVNRITAALNKAK